MSKTKIRDRHEAEQWVREGRTYDWCRFMYRQKYQVETSRSMWEKIRRQLKLDPRIVRNQALIPWPIMEQHKNAYVLDMLRTEARLRAGAPISMRRLTAVYGFKRRLRIEGKVINYDPANGFSKVGPRPGIDLDLIFEPNPEQFTALRTWRPAVAA